jgi:hypothetical protein
MPGVKHTGRGFEATRLVLMTLQIWRLDDALHAATR